jgi:Chaperone of endosialidase
MVQPNLIFNFAYQYVDLGSVSLTASAGGLSQTANAHAAFHVVMAGLTWRFAPGAAPWEGGYVGAHGGGAWGLNTDAIYGLVAIPSDKRLKRDIARIGVLDNGLGLYRFRYLWSDMVYVGVMAQEVALIRPDAVAHDALDDYLRVDYSRLGLRMMTLQEWQALGKGTAL